MHLSSLDPLTAPEATGGYVNGMQVERASRLLFISGTTRTQTREGRVPEGIEDQCRLAWANLTAVLAAADMDVTNQPGESHDLPRRSGIRLSQHRRPQRGTSRPSTSSQGGRCRDLGSGMTRRDRGRGCRLNDRQTIVSNRWPGETTWGRPRRCPLAVMGSARHVVARAAPVDSTTSSLHRRRSRSDEPRRTLLLLPAGPPVRCSRVRVRFAAWTPISPSTSTRSARSAG